MPYAVQSSMILLAPVLFSASIYMTLGRVIVSVGGEKHSLVRPSWLTKLFVIGDIFSLAVQGGAAGLMVTASNVVLGQNIILGGLGIQIIIFGLFCTTAVLFHVRMRRDVLAVERIPEGVLWEHVLWMLYGASALIMTRSIYRVVEFAMGNDGYLLSNEWSLFVFDAVPMLAVMGIFWQWFPSTVKKDARWGSVTSLSDLQAPRSGQNKGFGENRHGFEAVGV
jgi:RTA1 like protein